jgi:hypothetical protein
VALFALAVLLPSACSSHAATAPTVTATAIRTFVPFTSRGLSPSVHLLGKASGSCFSRSVAVNGDPAAYRCLDGNNLRDPCIENPGPDRTEFACVANPWSGAYLLTVTQPLPAAESTTGSPSAPYWAIELANGDRCTLSTGTSTLVAGVALYYSCGSGSAAGGFNTGHQPWTVQYQVAGAASLTTAAITVAWKG